MSLFGALLGLASLFAARKGKKKEQASAQAPASASTDSAETSRAMELGFLLGLQQPQAGQHTSFQPTGNIVEGGAADEAQQLLQQATAPSVPNMLLTIAAQAALRRRFPRLVSLLTPQQRGGLAYPWNPTVGLGLSRWPREEGRGQGYLAGWLRRARQANQPPAQATPPQQRVPDPNEIARSINLTWGQQQLYRDLLARLGAPLTQAPFAYSQLAGPYLQYMQRALSGQAGLPQEAYRSALQQGLTMLARQATAARAQLEEELGRRGLLQSGLLARGLRGVEEARLSGVSELARGLAEQELAARVEAQRLAAQQLPQLYGVQAGALADLARLWLEQQRAELERARIAEAIKQRQAQEEAATWEALGSILGSVVKF